MVHELTPSRSELPPIDDWRTRDSRTLAYTVAVDDQGTPKDLTNDTVRWALLRKPYDGRGEAILTDADDGVTLQTEKVVDPEAGEFRVDVAEDTVVGWGPRVQRVTIDPPGDSRQTWVGSVTVTARGGGNG
jgi:hypothetical protein